MPKVHCLLSTKHKDMEARYVGPQIIRPSSMVKNIDSLIDRYLDTRDEVRRLKEKMRDILDVIDVRLATDKRFRERNWATRYHTQRVQVCAHERNAFRAIRVGKVRA